MQVKPMNQPMQIIPLSQPQAGQPVDDSHKMFQQLLDKMQEIMKPTDQSDPLAPVGVTPEKTASSSSSDNSAGEEAKKGASSGLLGSLEELLGGGGKKKSGGSSSSSSEDGHGLGDILTGKKTFGETKIGKVVGAVEGIGKLLALI